MLQPDFYSFLSLVSNGHSSLEASFLLYPEHPIFGGHFPGQPVVPGVCMLQIIKEALEKAIGKKLFLAQTANIKFLSMLVPVAKSEIYLRAEFAIPSENELMVANASLSSLDDNFIKLSNARYHFIG